MSPLFPRKELLRCLVSSHLSLFGCRVKVRGEEALELAKTSHFTLTRKFTQSRAWLSVEAGIVWLLHYTDAHPKATDTLKRDSADADT